MGQRSPSVSERTENDETQAGALSSPATSNEGQVLEFSGPVEIVDGPTVEPVEPTDERGRRSRPLCVRSRQGCGTTTCRLSLACAYRTPLAWRTCSVSVAFEVFVKPPGGRALSLGTVTSGVSAGGQSWSWENSADRRTGAQHATNFRGGKADVILRPRLASAAQTTDLTRACNGEIVLRDVEFSSLAGQTRTGVTNLWFIRAFGGK